MAQGQRNTLPFFMALKDTAGGFLDRVERQAERRTCFGLLCKVLFISIPRHGVRKFQLYEAYREGGDRECQHADILALSD